MALDYEISIVRGTADEVKIAGSLADADAEILASFVGHADALFESRPLREGVPCELTLSFDFSRLGGAVNATLPDDDSLAIILHRMRPLILQRERASFVNASSIIGRVVPDSNIRAVLREQRQLFENAERVQSYAFNNNNIRINAESVRTG